MSRKAALLIIVLSSIGCSALFSYWVIFNFNARTTIVVFIAYFFYFFLAFMSIYGIMHKIKANKYMLGSDISAIVAFTCLLKALQYQNIFLGIVLIISLVCCIVLTSLSAKHERNQQNQQS